MCELGIHGLPLGNKIFSINKVFLFTGWFRAVRPGYKGCKVATKIYFKNKPAPMCDVIKEIVAVRTRMISKYGLNIIFNLVYTYFKAHSNDESKMPNISLETQPTSCDHMTEF